MNNLLDLLPRRADPEQIGRMDAELASVSTELSDLEPQVSRLAIEAILTEDFAPARELGARLRTLKERHATLTADRALAMSAREKRLEQQRARDEAAKVRAVRARVGELNSAVKSLDATLADIGIYFRKAEDALGALVALHRDVAWPPGSGSLIGETVELAAEAAVIGEPLPRVTDAIEELRAFLRQQPTTEN